MDPLPLVLASFLPSFGPPHLAAAMGVLVLYTIQAEIRFGSTARSGKRGAADRGSTMLLSYAVVIPIAGLVLAIKAITEPTWTALAFFRPTSPAALPGMPALAWVGIGVALLGLALRMWAVLVLRERYTRTLLVHEGHTIERRGPYGFVRHPGYLGSLLCLNGITLATGNAVVVAISLVATLAAYVHRIRAEDAMLVAAFGESYERYRREVRGLVPFIW